MKTGSDPRATPSDAPGAIASLVQNILKAETSSGLFSLRLDAVQIYPFFRMPLYYEMTRQLGILEAQFVPSLKSRGANVGLFLKHALCQNEFWGIKPRRIAVMEHPRRVLFQGKSVEPCTGFLLRDWNEDYAVLRWPMQERYPHDSSLGERAVFYDYFAIKRRVMRSVAFFPEKEMGVLSEKVEEAFRKQVDSRLNLKKFILEKIRHAILGIPIARAFWAKLRPRLVLTVVAYAHPDLIWTAKQMKIPVVELQHGIISPYHLGYHYPDQKTGEVETFPDYLFSYGDFWKHSANFPIHEEKVLSVGYPFFEIQKQSGVSGSRDPKSIVFISQKVIGAALSLVAIEVAKQLPEFKILYKLHPKQEGSWKTELPVLAETLRKGECGNLKVVTESMATVYDCFRESAWQVGVFSTALYEGLGFGLQTMILDFPGSEYLEALVKEGHCLKVKNAAEAISLIQGSKRRTLIPEKLFQKNSLDRMKQKIQEISES